MMWSQTMDILTLMQLSSQEYLHCANLIISTGGHSEWFFTEWVNFHWIKIVPL